MIYDYFKFKKKDTSLLFCITCLVLFLSIVGIGCLQGHFVNNKQWYIDSNSYRLFNAINYSSINSIDSNARCSIFAKQMWKYIDNNKIPRDRVVVAVIDSGVDIKHKAIKNSIYVNTKEVPNDQIDNDANGFVDDYNGYNFLENNCNITQNIASAGWSNHGTACAGLIAANDNDKHFWGIAKDIATIMPIKAFDSTGEQEDVDIIVNSIRYAEDNGARICNISFSTPTYSRKLFDAIQNSKMLFVVSAGNSYPKGRSINKDSFPAAYSLSNVISVASIDQFGNLDTCSNWGKVVDVAAPGSNIYSTACNNNYSYYDGTSMATAIVTGLSAQLMSADRNLLPVQVKKIIIKTCTKSIELQGVVKSSGYINCYKAISYITNRRI